MSAKSMITCLMVSGCLLTVAPMPSHAANKIGERIATCSGEALEPLCLLALEDEAIIVAEEGDACMPQSVSVDAAAALAFLRNELRTHTERADNNEENEEVHAYAALWPCNNVPLKR
jgi:hypothetical protein